ncbi:lipopolysaccharide kinase InaA family protein [Pseudomonas typographi]|uniref:Phosphotransferase n=1 Tax=Pseudomonas typographi TaxID=2715964 RepID=A0ABR7YVW8_9PSED|nr:lipopolysaccharide kinase InaA family protein [Pseudomonas typographi]MBD1549871.1 phosphotransferase [Pseudomonas typographi]MBD1585252.1 phosphotransferase [Pseudomonas typographi]MBD1597299.1 phosphotransferase [Pseudomonas typographi]
MRLGELQRAGREPELPLAVELADGAGSAPLQLLNLLRVLPGQRYVGAAVWRGKPVLAKLLVGPKAARHFQRERDGVRLLQAQGLATPALVADGLQEGQGGWLLFELLDPVQSLGDAWAEVASLPLLADAQIDVLAEALGAMARMHLKGLWQQDLHLDNLLRSGGQLYVIDGAGIRAEQPGQPLSRERVLANLGVFFAQLPPALEPFTEELLVHYLLANSEHALPLEALHKHIASVRRWRLRDYLGKAGRDCTLFSVSRGLAGLQAIRRTEQAALLPVLEGADTLIEQGHLYKTGGAATVARVQAGTRPLIIKRYNIKGLAHWLKRFWRPSRAWHSWLAGHRLAFLGFATPMPLAVREARVLGLRGRAWLVTEYLEGPDILEQWAPYEQTGDVPEAEWVAMQALFARLAGERISHGDLKGHNLFWHRGQWALIDLDALQYHTRAAAFAKAHRRDVERFLRNWPEGSALRQRLEQVLG